MQADAAARRFEALRADLPATSPRAWRYAALRGLSVDAVLGLTKENGQAATTLSAEPEPVAAEPEAEAVEQPEADAVEPEPDSEPTEAPA